MKRLAIWWTLARGVVLETVRRKDLYVVAILALLIIGGAGMVGFFGVDGIEVFVKDLTFGVISLFATLICIMTAARQLPDEIQRRTLYPLLARPITRFDFVVGKFLGAYLVSVVAFLMLTLVGFGAMSYFQLKLGGIFWQFIALKLLGLWMLTSITFALSLFTTPAANVTLCMLLALGASTISRAVTIAFDTLTPGAQGAVKGFYFVLPHLNLFELGKKVAYGWPVIPMWVLGALALYAVCYSAAMIMLSWVKFERQAI